MTRISQNISPDTTFADARRFMARVVPWTPDAYQNLHWFSTKVDRHGRPYVKGTPARDLIAFMEALKRRATKDETARDIYFCTSSQRKLESKTTKSTDKTFEIAARSAEDAVELKSFFLDIDVGKKTGYQTYTEALAGLAGLVKVTGLPKPTAVVLSGSGGFHVYWTVVDPIAASDWQPYANALSAAAQESGLLFDSVCTVDSARILRVPDTFNYKSDPPNPVQLAYMLEFDYLNEKILSCLQPWVGKTGKSLAKTRGKLAPDENDEFLSNPDHEYPPRDIDKIAEQCGWIKRSLETGGADNNNMLRRYAYTLAVRCTNPEETARRLTHKRETLTEGEFEGEWARALDEEPKGKAPPPTCSAIHREGAAACKSCPLLAKDKMPLAFESSTGEPSEGAGEPSEKRKTPRESFEALLGKCHRLQEREHIFDLHGSLVLFKKSHGSDERFVEKLISAPALRALMSKNNMALGKEAAQEIIAIPEVYGFRPVIRCADMPFLMPDGTVISTAGYHAPTKTFLRRDVGAEAFIPEFPTKRDAYIALGRLKAVFSECAYADAVAEAATMSGVLTLQARNLMDVAPMHFIDAITAGTGKGFLMSTAARIAVGRDFPSTKFGKGEELDKQINSVLLSGGMLLGFDNVTERLEGDTLCSAITQPELQIRKLGSNAMPTVTNGLCVFGNGNNSDIPADMVRRIILVSLDRKMEHPEEYKFKRNATAIHRHIKLNQAKYVSYGLIIIKAFIQAVERGEARILPPAASFEGWSRYVRSPLVWLGMPDPLDTQKILQAEDTVRADRGRIFEAWNELTQGKEATVGMALKPFFAGGQLQTGAPGIEHLETLIEVVPRRPGSRADYETLANALGKYFRRSKLSIVGGLKLTPMGKMHGAQRWQICAI